MCRLLSGAVDSRGVSGVSGTQASKENLRALGLIMIHPQGTAVRQFLETLSRACVCLSVVLGKHVVKWSHIHSFNICKH